MTRKTYLFVSDTNYENNNFTGAHRRFLELITDFSKTDNVILVSRSIPQLKDADIKCYVTDGYDSRFIPKHITGIINICKTLKRQKKNIQYDNAISFGPMQTLCYKICGYKKVTMLFREDFIGYHKILNCSFFKLCYFRWLERVTVKYSDKIIVQCEDDKKNLIDRTKRVKKNIEDVTFVQINNVNASWMNCQKKVSKIKNNTKCRILFVGNFSDRRKGHDILLPAITRLIEENYNIELYVAGSGTNIQYYKEKFKNERIIFMGRVPNLNECLNDIDFEIVPSFMDSCPNTVLEALNAGVAVYGTNVGGIKDILLSKEYLFEPNEDSLYSFVKNVLDNKKYVDDAKNQIAIKERLTFDWSKKIKKIIND